MPLTTYSQPSLPGSLPLRCGNPGRGEPWAAPGTLPRGGNPDPPRSCALKRGQWRVQVLKTCRRLLVANQYHNRRHNVVIGLMLRVYVNQIISGFHKVEEAPFLAVLIA